MQKIVIKTVPKSKVRNDSVGDYKRGVDGSLIVLTAKQGNKDLEFLVALHELIESKLAEKRGITFTKIDSFDRKHLNSPEPGRMHSAPYHKEHMFAEKIEGLMAKELGLKNYL